MRIIGRDLNPDLSLPREGLLSAIKIVTLPATNTNLQVRQLAYKFARDSGMKFEVWGGEDFYFWSEDDATMFYLYCSDLDENSVS